ncbi:MULTISPECIES: DUF732 domain-containing protein [Mycobacterium]|uniref:DUF732 domain-containing protein n=3 Tax=Mycobacterium TaxID=1763 RepID=A0A1X1RR88_MYCCE|nr:MULTISPECIES: DUF732 domain-containing protein [Mycobacterium]MCV7231969.1 DUF732 domain-containing protein [Mycobacterium branderi]ORA34811.1 hypothetical protein BST20_19755 [Mycobacterium branderi]ORV13608.1 hypothetical protein AWB95_11200 [Mycobacterium celatum]PIB73951.1 DUF732 domain-containing protein [Mycobacterium celatum]
MKRLLLLLGFATMVGLAAPAHADETSGDAAFLAALDQQGITHRGASQAIAAGRAVCELMDGGLSPLDTVNAVRSTNPGFTPEHAARFAVTAASAYCPQHL